MLCIYIYIYIYIHVCVYIYIYISPWIRFRAGRGGRNKTGLAPRTVSRSYVPDALGFAKHTQEMSVWFKKSACRCTNCAGAASTNGHIFCRNRPYGQSSNPKWVLSMKPEPLTIDFRIRGNVKVDAVLVRCRSLRLWEVAVPKHPPQPQLLKNGINSNVQHAQRADGASIQTRSWYFVKHLDSACWVQFVAMVIDLV